MGSKKDQNALEAQNCVQAGIWAGVKSACITCVLTTIPTLIAVRKIPWAKANLNHTGQALIISSASAVSYFITVDKTILKGTRQKADSRYHRN